MKSLPRIVPASNLTTKPALARRRVKVMTAFALTSFVSIGVITMDGCDNQQLNFGPTKGQVVGVILGAAGVLGTTAVLIEVHHKPVSYTHLRAHETDSYLVCRLLL